MTPERARRTADFLFGAILAFLATAVGLSLPTAAHNDTTIVGCAHDREIIEKLDLILTGIRR